LADLEFDLELTGFEIPEIEVILDAADPARSEVEDEKLPELAPNSVVTRANDLWILGDHRLFCGDARRSDSFTTLLLKETADLVFVDPPYNVRISGHVSGKGRVKHREFAQASGEKTPCPFRKLYPRVR
jgi:hypothetical protein